jgi:hypothetical protein
MICLRVVREHCGRKASKPIQWTRKYHRSIQTIENINAIYCISKEIITTLKSSARNRTNIKNRCRVSSNSLKAPKLQPRSKQLGNMKAKRSRSVHHPPSESHVCLDNVCILADVYQQRPSHSSLQCMYRHNSSSKLFV